jgi:hypothetical protein
MTLDDKATSALLRNFISFYHQAYQAAVWSSRHNYLLPSIGGALQTWPQPPLHLCGRQPTLSRGANTLLYLVWYPPR